MSTETGSHDVSEEGQNNNALSKAYMRLQTLSLGVFFYHFFNDQPIFPFLAAVKS